MSVKIEISYGGNLHCSATHGPSGITIQTDAPVDNGGKGETFSPTDLLATALGTCVITIMDMFANKTGIDLKGTKLHVTKEMSKSPPRRISDVTLAIEFPRGLDIPEKDRTKLERIVNSCPVKQSLHPDVNVHVDFIY